MRCAHVLLALVLSVWTMTSSATAAEVVVFDEDFSSGVRGDIFNLDTDISTLSLESSSPLLGDGPELRLENATSNLAAVVGYFDSVTLANPGDSIRFSFDAYNVDGGFIDFGVRFGLFNSNGTRITGDGDLDFDSATLDDDGFYAMVDVGTSTVNSSAFIRQNDDNTSTRLFGGETITNADNDGLSDPLMFTQNTATAYTLGLTLLADGSVETLLFSDDSGETPGDEGALLGSIATPVTLSFDTFYLGGTGDANSSADFRFDNLRVTSVTAIPEPASYAALVVIAGAAWLRRRSKS